MTPLMGGEKFFFLSFASRRGGVDDEGREEKEATKAQITEISSFSASINLIELPEDDGSL